MNEKYAITDLNFESGWLLRMVIASGIATRHLYGNKEKPAKASSGGDIQ